MTDRADIKPTVSSVHRGIKHQHGDDAPHEHEGGDVAHSHGRGPESAAK